MVVVTNSPQTCGIKSLQFLTKKNGKRKKEVSQHHIVFLDCSPSILPFDPRQPLPASHLQLIVQIDASVGQPLKVKRYKRKGAVVEWNNSSTPPSGVPAAMLQRERG